MLGCRVHTTPMELNHKLGLNSNSPLVDQGRYQTLVGKLIYLSHRRSDIAYVGSVVSQFSSEPNKEHMTVVFKIFRYLKFTPRKGL